MPAILTLTLIVVVVLIIALFIRDAKQAQQRHAGTADSGTDVVSHHDPPTPPRPPQRPEPPQPPPVNAEEIADHVRGLRQAVDDGLIGHEEAVESIMRQAQGGIGEEAAAKLLDGEGPQADDDGDDDRGGDASTER